MWSGRGYVTLFSFIIDRFALCNWVWIGNPAKANDYFSSFLLGQNCKRQSNNIKYKCGHGSSLHWLINKMFLKGIYHTKVVILFIAGWPRKILLKPSRCSFSGRAFMELSTIHGKPFVILENFAEILNLGRQLQVRNSCIRVYKQSVQNHKICINNKEYKYKIWN